MFIFSFLFLKIQGTVIIEIPAKQRTEIAFFIIQCSSYIGCGNGFMIVLFHISICFDYKVDIHSGTVVNQFRVAQNNCHKTV